MNIQGTFDPRLGAVADAFARTVDTTTPTGAAVCITRRSEIVVDLWAGSAEHMIPWDRDTVVNTFSATKAMTALCAYLLIDRGLLDVDTPVAHYWPEFAAEGKELLPVRYVLDHRIGLPWVSPGKDGHRLLDWHETCRRLAARAPMYPPGSRAVYHALSFGYLVGELVRRITGVTLGEFFSVEVARPLGVDFFIGMPADPSNTIAKIALSKSEGESIEVFPGIADSLDFINSTVWRSAEIPAVNGHGNARALATVMGALANGGHWNGVHLLRPESVNLMWQRSDGRGGGPHDPAWALGFMPNWNNIWGPADQAFGHTGFGGCMSLADPVSQVSISFVTNSISTDDSIDRRAKTLVSAFYESI